MQSITRGLNAVNGVKNEKRSFFILRFEACLYTTILVVMMILSVAVTFIGKFLMTRIMDQTGVNLKLYINLLENRHLVEWLILAVFFSILYGLVPYHKNFPHRMWRGGLFAGVTCTLFSWGFSFYLEHFHGFSMYGWDLPDPKRPSVQPLVDESGGGFVNKAKKGLATPIPFRVMVPQGCSNLLCPGRAISVERDVLGPLRVMAPCMAMGEACGVAAEQVVAGTANADVDAGRVRDILRANGCIVDAAALPPSGGAAVHRAEGRSMSFLRTHLRWGVVALLFFTALLNNLDRMVLSVLAPTLKESLAFGDVEYSYVVAAFLAAYALGYTFCGKVLDRVGVKLGMMAALVFWSVAAMGHAAAVGWLSLAAFRFLLGLGESFNSPGGVKAIAEWVPRRERGLCMAVFSNGNVLGSIIAPPLVAFLSLHLGWRWAFGITGGLGLVLWAVWRHVYHSPENHPRLTEEERAVIEADRAGGSRS